MDGWVALSSLGARGGRGGSVTSHTIRGGDFGFFFAAVDADDDDDRSRDAAVDVENPAPTDDSGEVARSTSSAFLPPTRCPRARSRSFSSATVMRSNAARSAAAAASSSVRVSGWRSWLSLAAPVAIPLQPARRWGIDVAATGVLLVARGPVARGPVAVLHPTPARWHAARSADTAVVLIAREKRRVRRAPLLFAIAFVSSAPLAWAKKLFGAHDLRARAASKKTSPTVRPMPGTRRDGAGDALDKGASSSRWEASGPGFRALAESRRPHGGRSCQRSCRW